LSIPLTEIIWENGVARYEQQKWHISPFKLDAEHFGCLASDREIPDLTLKQVQWTELLPETI
jgi:hypothetical protein